MLQEEQKIKNPPITVGWFIYFVISILIVLLGGIYQKSDLLSIIASIFGIAYVLLIAKEKRIAFWLGAINVFTYGIVLWKQQIYSGVIYNIFYSLPMLIYGFFIWGKASKKENKGIRVISKRNRILLTGISTVIIIINAIILKKMGGNHVILDSITSILGYIGIYLMSNKYIEQWSVWIIANLSNVILWIMLTIENMTNLPVFLMWMIYFINSVYGYLLWRKYNKRKV